jgi:hypothetical protein
MPASKTSYELIQTVPALTREATRWALLASLVQIPAAKPYENQKQKRISLSGRKSRMSVFEARIKKKKRKKKTGKKTYVDGVVGLLDQLRLRVKPHDAHHRAKDFLLGNGHGLGNLAEHRRLNEVATSTAKKKSDAGLLVQCHASGKIREKT